MASGRHRVPPEGIRHAHPSQSPRRRDAACGPHQVQPHAARAGNEGRGRGAGQGLDRRPPGRSPHSPATKASAASAIAPAMPAKADPKTAAAAAPATYAGAGSLLDTHA